MANTIPCPNPACSHDFPAVDLQKAASLQCPKCGFRMQGRAPAPANTSKAPPTAKPAPVPSKASPPAKPAPAKPVPATPPAKSVPVAAPVPQPQPQPQAKAAPPAKATPPAKSVPVAAPPVASPIAVGTPAAPPAPPATTTTTTTTTATAAGNPPVASPVTTEDSVSDGMFFNPGATAPTGPLVQTSREKPPFRWAKLLILLFAVGFAASIVISVVTLIIWFAVGSGVFRPGSSQDTVTFTGTIRGSKDTNEKVYQLALSKQEWSVDTEIQSKFNAHVAWKHNDYDFWFGLVVKDYGSQKPRDSEMLRVGIDRLENYYGDTLELDTKAKPTRVGELAAQKLTFKGQVKAANWLGECYMFFNNGVGYWLFVASPDWSIVEHFAEELPKKNLTILSDRRGWREQPPPMETFVSENTKVTMSAPKGTWEKFNAKNEDENGELLLLGRYLKEKEKDNRKNVSMLMFTMEKKGNLNEAMKAARDYIDLKTKNENANDKIVHAPDSGKETDGQTESGILSDIGNRRGNIIDLKLQFRDEPKAYLFLAVLNEADICYVILCRSSWDHRQLWRQDFLDLMRTIQVK